MGDGLAYLVGDGLAGRPMARLDVVFFEMAGLCEASMRFVFVLSAILQ